MAEKEEIKTSVSVEEEEEEEEPMILCMTKKLIPCKLLIFVLDAGSTSLYSFLSLFYVSSGLTVTQLGLLNGICSGFSMIAHPVWGSIVDLAMKHRTLLVVSLSLSTSVLEFGKPWVIMFFSKTETVINCLGNTTVVQYALFDAGKNCSTHTRLLNPNTVFYAATVNGIFSTIAISGVLTFLEGAVVKTVFGMKEEHSYGEQKVFGPIGMAIGSFAAGVAVDHYKPKHLSPYLAAFYIYLPLSLLQMPLLYILTKQAKWDYGIDKKDKKKTSIKTHVIKSFRKGDNIMFLLSAFIGGLASCVYGHVLFLYMYRTMNPTKTVMSLMSVASPLSELFVYPFSSKLIKIFGGHMRCIITGLFMNSVRLAVLATPWAVLPLAMMSGITSSLTWTALIEKTSMLFPKEITNTAIGVLVICNWTGANIISNIVGSFFYNKFGGARLFRAMAIINTVWCMIMFVYFELRKKTPATPEKDKSVEKGYSQNIEIELEEGHTV